MNVRWWNRGCDNPSCAVIPFCTVCFWQLSGPRFRSRVLVSSVGGADFFDIEKKIPHMIGEAPAMEAGRCVCRGGLFLFDAARDS
jgi:hypothetical protein